MTDLRHPTIRCEHCGSELVVQSITSDGAYCVCPCGRTTATTHVMRGDTQAIIEQNEQNAPDYAAGEAGDYQP